MHDAVSLCRPTPPSSCADRHRPRTSTLPPPRPAGHLPVADWLAAMSLERYAARLESAGVRSAEDAAGLQQQDLVALGITLAGHQKKILSSAHAAAAAAAVMMRPAGSLAPSSSSVSAAAAAAAAVPAVGAGASFV